MKIEPASIKMFSTALRIAMPMNAERDDDSICLSSLRCSALALPLILEYPQRNMPLPEIADTAQRVTHVDPLSLTSFGTAGYPVATKHFSLCDRPNDVTGSRTPICHPELNGRQATLFTASDNSYTRVVVCFR
jgi:hypothetical protein